jgi:hypothetical protein
MSYVTNSIIAIDLTEVSTVPQQAQGTVLQANDGVYQYVQATAAVAQYAMVKITDNISVAEGTTTLLPSTEPASVGIAQVAIAEDSYGWVFVGPGLATCKVASSCAADVKILTTATAGVVDDAGGTLIQGLTLLTATVAAASAPVLASQKLVTAAQT